jgi:D-alanyl-lipoteichoic acid acyltransferase DltB (MBOAT superfamily)
VIELRPASPQRRFEAWALELVLVIGTGYVGWLIWSLITWSTGQTPAQRLLRMISLSEKSSRPAGRTQMFVRYVLIFCAYWLGYFAISNLASAFNLGGVFLALGITMLIAVHVTDISAILRRSDHRRLADVTAGIVIKEIEDRS